MSIDSHYGTSNIVIQRATSTADGTGGYTKTWATHLTINGLIRPLSAQEMMISERIGDKSTHKLYCDAGQDILETDRVYCNDDELTYKITARPVDPNNRGHHFEIILEQTR